MRSAGVGGGATTLAATPAATPAAYSAGGLLAAFRAHAVSGEGAPRPREPEPEPEPAHSSADVGGGAALRGPAAWLSAPQRPWVADVSLAISQREGSGVGWGSSHSHGEWGQQQQQSDSGEVELAGGGGGGETLRAVVQCQFGGKGDFTPLSIELDTVAQLLRMVSATEGRRSFAIGASSTPTVHMAVSESVRGVRSRKGHGFMVHLQLPVPDQRGERVYVMSFENGEQRAGWLYALGVSGATVLPDGWKLEGVEKGRPYYYNPVKGGTQYEPPPPPPKPPSYGRSRAPQQQRQSSEQQGMPAESGFDQIHPEVVGAWAGPPGSTAMPGESSYMLKSVEEELHAMQEEALLHESTEEASFQSNLGRLRQQHTAQRQQDAMATRQHIEALRAPPQPPYAQARGAAVVTDDADVPRHSERDSGDVEGGYGRLDSYGRSFRPYVDSYAWQTPFAAAQSPRQFGLSASQSAHSDAGVSRHESHGGSPRPSLSPQALLAAGLRQDAAGYLHVDPLSPRALSPAHQGSTQTQDRQLQCKATDHSVAYDEATLSSGDSDFGVDAAAFVRTHDSKTFDANPTDGCKADISDSHGMSTEKAEKKAKMAAMMAAMDLKPLSKDTDNTDDDTGAQRAGLALELLSDDGDTPQATVGSPVGHGSTDKEALLELACIQLKEKMALQEQSAALATRAAAAAALKVAPAAAVVAQPQPQPPEPSEELLSLGQKEAIAALKRTRQQRLIAASTNNVAVSATADSSQARQLEPPRLPESGQLWGLTTQERLALETFKARRRDRAFQVAAADASMAVPRAPAPTEPVVDSLTAPDSCPLEVAPIQMPAQQPPPPSMPRQTHAVMVQERYHGQTPDDRQRGTHSTLDEIRDQDQPAPSGPSAQAVRLAEAKAAKKAKMARMMAAMELDVPSVDEEESFRPVQTSQPTTARADSTELVAQSEAEEQPQAAPTQQVAKEQQAEETKEQQQVEATRIAAEEKACQLAQEKILAEKAAVEKEKRLEEEKRVTEQEAAAEKSSAEKSAAEKSAAEKSELEAGATAADPAVAPVPLAQSQLGSKPEPALPTPVPESEPERQPEGQPEVAPERRWRRSELRGLRPPPPTHPRHRAEEPPRHQHHLGAVHTENTLDRATVGGAGGAGSGVRVAAAPAPAPQRRSRNHPWGHLSVHAGELRPGELRPGELRPRTCPPSHHPWGPLSVHAGDVAELVRATARAPRGSAYAAHLDAAMEAKAEEVAAAIVQGVGTARPAAPAAPTAADPLPARTADARVAGRLITWADTAARCSQLASQRQSLTQSPGRQVWGPVQDPWSDVSSILSDDSASSSGALSVL
jgi:hypothetical protein